MPQNRLPPRRLVLSAYMKLDVFSMTAFRFSPTYLRFISLICRIFDILPHDDDVHYSSALLFHYQQCAPSWVSPARAPLIEYSPVWQRSVVLRIYIDGNSLNTLLIRVLVIWHTAPNIAAITCYGYRPHLALISLLLFSFLLTALMFYFVQNLEYLFLCQHVFSFTANIDAWFLLFIYYTQVDFFVYRLAQAGRQPHYRVSRLGITMRCFSQWKYISFSAFSIDEPIYRRHYIADDFPSMKLGHFRLAAWYLIQFHFAPLLFPGLHIYYIFSSEGFRCNF